MGRSTTPKHVAVFKTNDKGHAMTPFAWRPRAQHGRPGDGVANEKNLAKFVAGYNASFEADGTNAHLSEAVGFTVWITHAAIYENRAGGALVAEYNAPAFEVAASAIRPASIHTRIKR